MQTFQKWSKKIDFLLAGLFFFKLWKNLTAEEKKEDLEAEYCMRVLGVAWLKDTAQYFFFSPILNTIATAQRVAELHLYIEEYRVWSFRI